MQLVLFIIHVAFFLLEIVYSRLKPNDENFFDHFPHNRNPDIEIAKKCVIAKGQKYRCFGANGEVSKKSCLVGGEAHDLIRLENRVHAVSHTERVFPVVIRNSPIILPVSIESLNYQKPFRTHGIDHKLSFTFICSTISNYLEEKDRTNLCSLVKISLKN